MKKRTNLFFLASTAFAFTLCVSACNQGEEVNVPMPDFDFTLRLNSGRKNVIYLNHDEFSEPEDKVVPVESNKPKKLVTTYEYRIPEQYHTYVTIDPSDGTLHPHQVTPEGMKVPVMVSGGDIEEAEEEEPLSWKDRQTWVRVINKKPNANRGANYSTDVEDKTEILGQLEGYAMNNFLTGITLFENGGWIRYSKRVNLPVDEYVDGYGFGLLSEGSLNGELAKGAYNKKYLQSVSSSETYTINAWNATGSQVSDLNSYISSSFWSQKLGKDDTDPTKDVAKWYPLLAKDKIKKHDLVNGGIETDPETSSELVDNLRPVPVAKDASTGVVKLVSKEAGNTNEKGLYRRWRVYVKTGSDYKYKGVGSFNDRPIALEDYEFVFKMLLTQSTALTRGAELASDTSYGIRGGYNYFRKTKNSTAAQANGEWTRFKENDEIGIYTGHEDINETTGELGNGDYIEFELINPVDAFTAMYTLSSNLYSPLPEDFMNSIGGTGKWVKAGKLYGTWGGAKSTDEDTAWIRSHTLCVGPFYIERWDLGKTVVFARNEDWYECDDNTSVDDIDDTKRYHIPGVVITINTNAGKDPDAAYKMLGTNRNNQIDSCAVPKSILEKYGPDESIDKKAKGDSTFKLNVNACTQERSEELFGENGIIKKHDPARKVHGWMSNNNFLRGLFWSINRGEFADKRGVGSSYEYFADSYQSDPDNNTSYNKTEAHKDALKAFDEDLVKEDPTTHERVYPDGYDKGKATIYFQAAVAELLEDKVYIKKLGTASNPKKLTIDIWWMNQSDINEYGADIKNYFKAAFEDSSVCGKRLVLNVRNQAVTQWEQVYNDHLMTGDFDLGFGAISGNSLNPLNFMEVLRSDNSSSFTLNWGADTGKISDQYPIEFDGKEWTYDALWSAGDHGVIAQEGQEVDAVEEKNGYMTAPRQLADPSKLIDSGDMSQGGILRIPFSFVKVSDGVELNITRIQLYLVGSDAVPLKKKSEVEEGESCYEIKTGAVGDYTGQYLEITISQADGQRINKAIYDDNELADVIKDLDKNKDKDTIALLTNPFQYTTYIAKTSGGAYEFWQIEIYYDLTIDGGMPTENVYYVSKNKSDFKTSNKYSLAQY